MLDGGRRGAVTAPSKKGSPSPSWMTAAPAAPVVATTRQSFDNARDAVPVVSSASPALVDAAGVPAAPARATGVLTVIMAPRTTTLTAPVTTTSAVASTTSTPAAPTSTGLPPPTASIISGPTGIPVPGPALPTPPHASRPAPATAAPPGVATVSPPLGQADATANSRRILRLPEAAVAGRGVDDHLGGADAGARGEQAVTGAQLSAAEGLEQRAGIEVAGTETALVWLDGILAAPPAPSSVPHCQILGVPRRATVAQNPEKPPLDRHATARSQRLESNRQLEQQALGYGQTGNDEAPKGPFSGDCCPRAVRRSIGELRQQGGLAYIDQRVRDSSRPVRLSVTRVRSFPGPAHTPANWNRLHVGGRPGAP